MSELAIRVSGLGKRYNLGATGPRAAYRTLREELRDAVTRPFRRRDPGEPFWALKDVSLEIARGEIVGVIGRNGAGKSTLLKILSRITEPTEGEADLYGRVGSLLEVGTGFHPELTGRENVYLNGAILGMTRAEIGRKFAEIVAFAEVEKFIDTPVKFYSSGMYVRLAFAVAAHLETEILVVDEVLAVGDAAFQKRVLGKMGDIAKGGRAVLFVSHNMAAVQQLCSSGVLIRSGRLHRIGPIGDVIREYLSDALAGEAGVFDVSAHPARQRHHQPIIRRITLAGADGLPRTEFLPQDSLVIGLELVVPRRVREPRVAVAIEDHLGRRITTVANYFSPVAFPDLEGTAEVRCTIPRLSLGVGRYLVSASIGEKNQTLMDSIDGVAWFGVGWDNNYGTGEEYHPVYGPVLCPSVWEVVAPPPNGGGG